MSKRREFNAQFKLETVLEALRCEKSVAQLWRERNITDSLCYKWRDAILEAAPQILADSTGMGWTTTPPESPNWSGWLDA